MLDAFREEGRSFLMPPISTRLSEDSVIDISHESLIRQWKRLKDWTKDEDKARQTGAPLRQGNASGKRPVRTNKPCFTDFASSRPRSGLRRTLTRSNKRIVTT